jgi:deoxyribodipyrimidine photo-lyase
MSRALVWFRNDLRLHDHPALTAAIAAGHDIIPVYCFDDRLQKNSSIGLPRCGEHRLHFLTESVSSLQQSIADRGGVLLTLQGNPAVEISHLAQELQVNAVYFHYEIGIEERADEAKLIALLENTSIQCFGLPSGDLLDEKDLPFSLEKLPVMFTEFRKKVEGQYPFKKPLDTPQSISFYIPQTHKIHSYILEKTNKLPHPLSAVPFSGGEAAGLERLHAYLFESKNISQYKLTRNGLIGTDYSSKFSLWLASGSLSPRQIAHAVHRYENSVEANDSTYWMIFELLWREYFRWVHRQHGQLIFSKDGIKINKIHTPKMEPSPPFERWCTGTTGDAFVDANMRELNATGWMSNRGRQNVASYLVHDLGLDWRMGAYYFENKLMDYDVSSNWCNWMYIAGVGNDPRPFRKFNTTKQANDYDPNGTYRQLWNGRH